MADVRDRLAELSAAAWTYTAIGVAVELGLPSQLREPTEAASLAAVAGIPVALATSLAEALVAGGLARRTGGACFVAEPSLGDMAVGPPAELLRAETRTGLLQMAAFFDAATRGSVQVGWAHTDERILQAQGTMSAGAIDVLEKHVLPRMSGMLDRLDSADGAFLDVGAGVAAVSIALCRQHPRLRAVALEPHEPARRVAERNVADAGLGDRIEIRAGRVEALEAREEFDLVWVSGNFLGSHVLPSALAAVHRALRPGGYVLNASLGGGGDDQRSVAARLSAVLWGSDTVDPEHVADWLSDTGFCDVVLMPRLPNGLVPMHARRL